MAETSDKDAENAEKAYAAAVAEAKPVEAKEPEAAPEPAQAATPAPAVKMTRKAAPKKAAAKRTAKPVAKPVRAVARAKVAKPAAVAAKVRKPAPRRTPKKVSAPSKFARVPTVSELKDKIMATAQKTIGTTDFTKPINEAIGEFQTKAKAAYEKGTEALTEATEFAKGNVEAIVESGKILSTGAQSLGKTYVEEAKSAYETLTGDLKELAAVKSPTELFQLQGKIARRNFDALVATSSKNTEAVIKLAGDAFAPLSGRVNLAAEKIAKAA